LSDALQSVLTESRRFAPPAEFAARARINAQTLSRLHAEAEADPIAFWAQRAREALDWHQLFTIALDTRNAPNYRWFTDGRLNASYNCIDRHLEARADQQAIRFEGERGDCQTYTYRELHRQVCKVANALREMGVRRGDRVVLYMPMIPQAVMAMQACARLGAVHSVVFGGFSSHALRDRIEDASAKVVITADGGWRGGHIVELKRAVDHALDQGCRCVEHVLVLERTAHGVPMRTGRDHWWHARVEHQSEACTPEWVDAEHPLFLLYTSGSTGKPKGIQHPTGGYLTNATVTSQWIFDLRDGDLFWCTADVGWITGHTYVAYGPLSAGTTIMMYEGAPTVPDAGRVWSICEQHGVTIFYTAPTAIRALMRAGEEFPNRHDLSKLRLLGSVGEPINPEAWMWYHRVIGKEKLPIVDTWWQTETGAAMISSIPGASTTKPGSCGQPLPGIFVDIVDENGQPVKDVNTGGYLVVTHPWPSMLRTVWGDNARYRKTYFGQFGSGLYVAGDSAHRDVDGDWWVMGRVDDVLNVSGHRLGTMEIESALVAHPRVAEAAVVGRPHDIKGEAVVAFVSLRDSRPIGIQAQALANSLCSWVAQEIGPIAKPDEIRIVDNLPKTRSGKIMRRLLRTIAKGEAVTQDLSTLENPAIIEQLSEKL
jgi:acetyl-CoA synthetase